MLSRTSHSEKDKYHTISFLRKKKKKKRKEKMKRSSQSNLVDKKTDLWSQLMRSEMGSEGWEKWVKMIFKNKKHSIVGSQEGRGFDRTLLFTDYDMQAMGGWGVCWFSGGEKTGSFATPWTGSCQAPLSMEFSVKNTRVGNHSLFQGIFPTQRLNLDLLHCRRILYCPSHQGNPENSSVLITNLIFPQDLQ